MRRLILAACLVFLTTSVAEASILSRLAGVTPPGLNLSMIDESREVFVDAGAGNVGSIGIGDILYGFARVDTTTPPSSGGNNEIYAIFSQTFDTTFTFTTDDGGTPGDPTDDTRTYRGGFVATTNPLYTLATLTADPLVSASAMIAFLDRSNGLPFTVDGAVDTLATMALYLASYAAEGDVRFTAGITELTGNNSNNDFFRFRSEPVSIFADPFATITLIPEAQTGNSLGSFGAGLSLVDNFYAPGLVTFNEVVASSYDGRGGLGAFDFSVSSGNFTGTDQLPGAGTNPVQGGFATFLDNADLSMNATVNPEPASLGIWGLMALVVGGVGRYRLSRNRKNT